MDKRIVISALTATPLMLGAFACGSTPSNDAPNVGSTASTDSALEIVSFNATAETQTAGVHRWRVIVEGKKSIIQGVDTTDTAVIEIVHTATSEATPVHSMTWTNNSTNETGTATFTSEKVLTNTLPSFTSDWGNHLKADIAASKIPYGSCTADFLNLAAASAAFAACPYALLAAPACFVSAAFWIASATAQLSADGCFGPAAGASGPTGGGAASCSQADQQCQYDSDCCDGYCVQDVGECS